MELVGFKKRLFVYLIDISIAIMIGVGASVPLFLFTAIPWLFNFFFIMLFSYVAYFSINTFIMHISKGHSLGGLILWVRTLNADGSEMSLKKIMEKNLYFGLVPFALVDAIDYVVNQPKKLLFDHLTDTIEIDIKKTNFTV